MRATTSTLSPPSRSLLLHSVSLQAPSRLRGYFDRQHLQSSLPLLGGTCVPGVLWLGVEHIAQEPLQVEWLGPCQHLPCFDSPFYYLRLSYYTYVARHLRVAFDSRVYMYIFFLEFLSSLVRRSNSDLLGVILAHKHQYRRVGAVIGRSHPKRQFILTFNSDGHEKRPTLLNFQTELLLFSSLSPPHPPSFH